MAKNTDFKQKRRPIYQERTSINQFKM